MNLHATTLEGLEPDTAVFYRQALHVLTEAEVPFLVGGAYALAFYTGIERHTKDIDIFVRARDCERTMKVLARAGNRTEVTFPHWLAKAYRSDDFIDIIFSSGNGLARVDDEWFEHAVRAVVLGEQVNLCPVEETIWSKGFIMERERYDGADVAHLLQARGPRLDWQRLLRRYGPHWRVLLSHLVLFGFIYPADRDKIPANVIKELLARLNRELKQPSPDERECNGTFLSREQYLPDVEKWGYADGRRKPAGPMTDAQITVWTNAIADEK